MTGRVDFYVLESSRPEQRFTFACRLTEKAYLLNLTVVLLSETAADAALLDELLWTFNERSFVPHEVRRAGAAREVAAASAPAAHPAPVQLTPELDPIDAADLLVNLSSLLPARLERFARIAEIIDADAERRRLGRERYKAYRELELTVDTHRYDDATGV